MKEKEIAYPDFMFDISPKGKVLDNEFAGENTFSGILEAFENCFYTLNEPDKKEEFESILKSLEQSLDISKDVTPWGVFYFNRVHQNIQLPFSFAQQLQIGDIFSWDCLVSNLDELTSFLSDYEFEVMFLITAKVYLTPNKIQFQVLANVTNFSLEVWEEALIQFRESQSLE